MQQHVDAPQGVRQTDFDRLIAAAFAIAWRERGESHLPPSDAIATEFVGDLKMFAAAESHFLAEKKAAGLGNWDLPAFYAFLDMALTWADLAYDALCFLYVSAASGAARYPSEALWQKALSCRPHSPITLTTLKGVDAAILLYERRAAGGATNEETERRLIVPLFPNAPILVSGWNAWKETWE